MMGHKYLLLLTKLFFTSFINLAMHRKCMNYKNYFCRCIQLPNQPKLRSYEGPVNWGFDFPKLATKSILPLCSR